MIRNQRFVKTLTKVKNFSFFYKFNLILVTNLNLKMRELVRLLKFAIFIWNDVLSMQILWSVIVMNTEHKKYRIQEYANL